MFPKPEKAKPGKRKPTAEEKRWLDWVAQQPCIACERMGLASPDVEIHHILRAGRRIGHLYSLALCPGHHRDQGEFVNARHPWKARFEAAYGTEAELLAKLQQRYAGGSQ